MTAGNLEVGDKVTAVYKTGGYIGEVAELTGSMKAAIKILAVIEHPTQGDLHNPMDPHVSFFHQRRALAYQEIALMPLATIKTYSGAVPDYKESLKRALETDIRKMTDMEAWAKRSLQELQQLKSEYFPNEN
jgi:kinase-associated protein B